MEKLTVVELRKEAKARGLRGYSKLLKKDLLALLGKRSSPPKRSPKRRVRRTRTPARRTRTPARRTRTPTRRGVSYDHVIEMFLNTKFHLNSPAKEYFNKLFYQLASDLKDEKFVSKIGYLGEAALEKAEEEAFTSKKIKGASTVKISNMLLYIANELIGLLQHAMIDSKKTEITVQVINHVIENDYDLSATFLKTELPN